MDAIAHFINVLSNTSGYLIFAAVFLIILLWNSIVIVGGSELAMMERRYFGGDMPEGHVIAMPGQVGVQARTLAPGLHYLIPFLFKVQKLEFVVIKEDEIGVVEAIDGKAIPAGRIFAQVVDGHNGFQDAEGFLNAGGEKGPQIEILPPGNYRINTVLFRISSWPTTVIPKGRIGLVTAMDGNPIPTGRLLAQHVDGHASYQNGQMFLSNRGQKGPQIDVLLPGAYRINTALFKVEIREATEVPADYVGITTALDGAPLPLGEFVAMSDPGHNDFQNAAKFLELRGQRGPQYDALRPGTYYINPWMFSVKQVNVTVVERGEVGVVVSNVGKKASDAPVADKSTDLSGVVGSNERYVVPDGYRGIQKDVMGPGRYYLNTAAAMIYVINTTNITIDWDKDEKTKFNPLKVISKDGFALAVSVKVVVRVRPEQAPYMVAKIGSIENLVDHVIHPMIDSSFRNQASTTSAMGFMQERQDEQRKAEERARAELNAYHVDCVSVLICQIELPQDLMDTQTKKIIAEQQKAMYEAEQVTEQARISTEKTRAQANQQASLVTAEIGVQIAEQEKAKAIKNAEGAGESERLKAIGSAAGVKAIGEAQASAILAKGKATAEAYQLQNTALGADAVTAIEVTKQIAEGKIKITPDLLVQGDGGGGLLSTFLAQLVSRQNTAMNVAAAAKAADGAAPKG